MTRSTARIFKTRRSAFLFLFASLLIIFPIISIPLYFAAPVEASVTFKPRVDAGGVIVGGEDYVYFGKFKHGRWDSNTSSISGYEGAATPVLWRVMSADMAGSPKRAVLLSHYLLDAMAYETEATQNVKDQQYYRGDGVTFSNTWLGSKVQIWLNDGTSGFLKDFSSVERGSIASPSPDGVSGTFVTLPSFWTEDDMNDPWYGWTYAGELSQWFGDNDVTDNGNTFGAHSLARRAHFKGAAFDYDSDNLGWSYWTRSPVASGSYYAWVVHRGGALRYREADYAGAAVRPALFLNLESLIFKSGSDVSQPAAEGGEISNPYILYLTSADKKPASAAVSGDKLTVAYAAADKVVHAYTGAPSGAELAKRFAVTASGDVVAATFATVSGDEIIVALASPVWRDEAVTVSYSHAVNCTDGLAFLSDATALKSFAAMSVTNDSTAPTEKIFFTLLASECEIRYTTNADGSVTVHVLIPAASGSDLSLLDEIRAVFEGITGYTNVKYSFVDDDGNETEIPELTETSARGAVLPPYLKIAFDLPADFDMSTLDNAAITKIFYALKGDTTEYAQTFPAGGLKLADMQKPETTTGGSGVGCGTGAAALIALISCAAFATRKKSRPGR